jgi:SAM-dependent methyltransferase
MLDPQPSMKDLSAYYPRRYYAYARYNPNTIKERFAIAMYKLFFGQRGNVLKKLLFLPLKHLLRGTHIIPGGRILDVGCGNGAFLYKMQAAGMEAHGIEFSPNGAKAAQRLGLNVKCGTLEQQKYPPKFFDVITLNHVFEHLPDPLGTLAELKRILKSDGRIIVAVPNAHSLARWLFGKYWSSLEIPRHLFIPNPIVMQRCARATGLRIESLRYLSFPAQFHVSLMYWLYRNRPVPLENAWINTSRILHALCLPLAYLVDFLHIGDVIEVTVAR